MKKLSILFLICCMACNNATDGDADTDTTNLPADTNLLTSPTDTADHINSNSGSISTDTTKSKRPSPDGASSSRKSAPNDPARLDTMKQ